MSFTPLDSFIRVSDAFVKFVEYVRAMKPEELNLCALEVRSVELEKVWKETQDKFNSCMLYLEMSEDTTRDMIESADHK